MTRRQWAWTIVAMVVVVAACAFVAVAFDLPWPVV